MANVTVNGQNYTGVNEVRLPITNGGGNEQRFVLPPDGTKNITQNGDYDVTQFANAHVSVSGQAPTLQQKNVTAPASGTTAVTPDSGYDGLSKVTVSPTPTETKSITANGTYTPTSGKHFSQVTVNVSGGGTTYDYVRQQKNITDPYGLFTMRTLAKPERVEIRITQESLPDWYLDAVVDFPTGTNLVTVEVQDETTGTLKLIASRSDYGFSCDVLYKYTGYDYEWWVWDDNTKSDAAIVDATVYSNSTVYAGFTPGAGFWHTDGKRILDEDGGLVLINGIGMMANTYNASSFSSQEKPRIQEISNASIAEIASIGFNVIRLNFGYQLFEDDDNPGVYKQAGWDWFDQIASWAAANNVKVIPTLHCPQGGIQSTVDGYDLWAVQANQDRLVAMWTAIANRYKNNTAIIGYGIVNELHLKLYDQSEASTFSAFSNLFQRIINAIRTVDTNHIIFAERGLRFYSDDDFKTFWDNPSATGSEFSPDDAYIFYPTLADSNLVVEYHEYYGSPRALGTHRQPLAKMEQHLDDTIVLFDRINGNDAPLFIGEYGCNWNYDGDVSGSEDYERLSWTRDAHEMYVRRGLAHDLHTYFGWDKSTQSPPSYLNSMGLRRSMRYLNPRVEDDVTNNANATLYQPLADIFASEDIHLQNKTFTSNGTYTADSGYDGLGTVTVNVSGDTPQTQEKTVTPSTSTQTVIPDSGKLLSKVTVNAMPTGSAGTPTATKGAVSNHQISVTPSVTNTTGYIDGGTKTGTPVTVSASELTSGSETKTQNGTYDVTNLKQLTVNVPAPQIQLQNKTVTENGDVTADSGYDGLGTVTVNVSGGSALFKSWDITVSAKKTSDYTLISGDPWIQQHYANDTIMLLLVGTKISHANSEVVLSIATNGKTFAKFPNNDEMIGLRSYVSSSGGSSNGIVTASSVFTAAFALNITSNGNVSIHLASANPLNVGTYRLYGWIVEGGFTN